MGGGGVIQQSKILLDAAMDPSIYHTMTTTQKDAVDQIQAKDIAARSQDDVNRLLVILAAVCGC